jgi:hypothetical protein
LALRDFFSSAPIIVLADDTTKAIIPSKSPTNAKLVAMSQKLLWAIQFAASTMAEIIPDQMKIVKMNIAISGGGQGEITAASKT